MPSRGPPAAPARHRLPRIRVLVFHGYLLRGTGSNVYNASLACALARLGHEVHLLCQDRHGGSLRWVDRVGEWHDGRLRVGEAGGASPGAGTITLYRPEIGGLLPVYVKDSYEGFEVKTFAELAAAELDRYVEANVAAVRQVLALAGGAEAALANHLVMGPAILARAGLGRAAGGPGYAVKIHGSALEYTVKADPDRFLPYAREGLDAAGAVLVGSRHTAESLWAALADPGLASKTRLGPPGVDTDLFAPVPDQKEARRRVRALASELRAEVGRAPGRRQDPRPGAPGPGAWGRDPALAAAALDWFAEAEGARVVFVGKLIVSKGVDLLLAAWPLVRAANPGARLLIVGFGELAGSLQRLWEALAGGDEARAREIARRGRALEGGVESPLRMLDRFLDGCDRSYWEAAAAAAGSVRFAGRLEHHEVGLLVPATAALAFPSTFPESFGMVAAEAAAAGALPVSAAHSGLAEVSAALAAALPPRVAPLVSFELGDGAVAELAACLNGWLALDARVRAEAAAALRDTVTRLWSWEGVARGVLTGSAGRIAELPALPAA